MDTPQHLPPPSPSVRPPSLAIRPPSPAVRPPSLASTSPVNGDLRRTFLLPGEMAFVREPSMLSTLLGSCVAVAVFDPLRKWGGLNHFMVPNANGTRLAPGKCGDQAIAQLLNLARLAGSDLARCKARIYGGGAVVGALGSGAGDIGQRNIEQAYVSLEAAKIQVAGEDTGGSRGRKLDFDTGNGAIRCSLIEASAASQRRDDLARRKIRVLVVDDSATVRRVLVAAIAGDPRLEVVGEAEDAFQAREQILAEDPDVLCLDVIMPRLDGLAFLRKIMQFKPIPTVIVSTVAKTGSDLEGKLLAAGAVAVIDKESLAIHQGLSAARAVLLPILHRAASTIVQPLAPT